MAERQHRKNASVPWRGALLGALLLPPISTATPPLDAEHLIREGVRLGRLQADAPALQRAFRLFCLAGLLGARDAGYHLGWARLHGRGVPADRGMAVGWFRRAARAGDATSRRILQRLADVPEHADDRCPVPDAAPDSDRATVVRLVGLLAPLFSLDPRLVEILIEVESGFDARARSPRGAIGLMQLMPETARRFGVDPENPLENLIGGMAYLAWLIEHFEGDLERALAGYNAGERAVIRHRGVPPYDETRSYVRRILARYRGGPARRPAKRW